MYPIIFSLVLHIYTHTHAHTHVYIHIYIKNKNIYKHINIYISIHISIFTSIYEGGAHRNAGEAVARIAIAARAAVRHPSPREARGLGMAIINPQRVARRDPRTQWTGLAAGQQRLGRGSPARAAPALRASRRTCIRHNFNRDPLSVV